MYCNIDSRGASESFSANYTSFDINYLTDETEHRIIKKELKVRGFIKIGEMLTILKFKDIKKAKKYHEASTLALYEEIQRCESERCNKILEEME